MSYRDDVDPPPMCPTCRQPAVLEEPLFGILRCPELHGFAWPRTFDGRGLAGWKGVRACSCGAVDWAFGFVPRRWWQRILAPMEIPEIFLFCRACGQRWADSGNGSARAG